MPRVSIIMPIYNGEEYLTDAIESILSQTFSDFEFIIINEFGSNDKVSAILAEFVAKDARIRVIQNQSRLGISASLNIGLSCASGEYIARMDGDDISLPQRLELQVAYMDAHPEIGMCGTRVIEFGSKAIDWRIETDSNQIASDLLFYTPCVHPTVMMRKSELEKYYLEYNPEFHATEDYELFVRLGALTCIANIDTTLYKYRVMDSNTTFKNNDIGVILYESIMKEQFLSFGLGFADEEIRILSPHYGMRGTKGLDAIKRLVDLDLMLKRILFSSSVNHKLKLDNLFLTLKRRYIEAYRSMTWACEDYDEHAANVLFERSIFTRPCFYHDNRINTTIHPVITVLIPTFNSEKYIADALWSILDQSFQDYEILVVNEYGSCDSTISIIQTFSDNRIRIIQNETRLGLADSLNLGIRESRGKYIARLDADDLAHSERLKLQYDFLESNPEYGVCGSWQHHFGIQTEMVHEPPTSHDTLKARFIYRCELCHSTLMLRKKFFVDHNLYYDNSFAAEDFELWTRAIHCFKFANLPLVLGEYRVGNDNITAKKLSALSYESGVIAARTIETYLDVKIPQSHILFTGNWINEFDSIRKRKDFYRILAIEEQVLKEIWKENLIRSVYAENALLFVINQRWKWVIHAWHHGEELTSIQSIDELFTNRRKFRMYIRKLRFLMLAKRIAAVDKSGKVYKYMKRIQDFFKKKRNASTKDFLKKLKSRLLPASSRSFHEFAKNVNAQLSMMRSDIKQLGEEANNITSIIDAQHLAASNDIILSRNLISLNEEYADILKAQNALLASTADISTKLQTNVEELNIMFDFSLMHLKQKKKAFLVGTSEHSNIGDAAITMGAQEFLKTNFPEYEQIELSTRDFDKRYSFFCHICNRNDLIFLQGGGNLGGKFLVEENIRRRIIADFPNNAIVILPQTIFFSEDDIKRGELALSQRIYSSHKKLILFTRGKESLTYARKFFPEVQASDALDMALVLNYDFNKERDGVLICLRDLNDESCLTQEQYDYIVREVSSYSSNVEKINNLHSTEIDWETREFVVIQTLKQYASHKLVVTDRLHGMLFAIMTNTPCIVFSAYNHKIKEFSEYFSDSSAISFLDKNFEALPNAIESALNLALPDYSVFIQNSFREMYDTMHRFIINTSSSTPQ